VKQCFSRIRYEISDKVLQLKAVCNQRRCSIQLRDRAWHGRFPEKAAIEANTGMETKNMEYIKLMLLGLNVDKRAVTALEYAMIASLIAVAAVTVITGLGTKLSTVLSTVSSAL
jgi:pilus assembly protein Flp/PilA